MKTVKMSLATIQGKLSRAEMKNIMAGSRDVSCVGKCPEGCSPGLVCGYSIELNQCACVRSTSNA